jgi:hypothetical protein
MIRTHHYLHKLQLRLKQLVVISHVKIRDFLAESLLLKIEKVSKVCLNRLAISLE